VFGPEPRHVSEDVAGELAYVLVRILQKLDYRLDRLETPRMECVSDCILGRSDAVRRIGDAVHALDAGGHCRADGSSVLPVGRAYAAQGDQGYQRASDGAARPQHSLPPVQRR